MAINHYIIIILIYCLIFTSTRVHVHNQIHSISVSFQFSLFLSYPHPRLVIARHITSSLHHSLCKTYPSSCHHHHLHQHSFHQLLNVHMHSQPYSTRTVPLAQMLSLHLVPLPHHVLHVGQLNVQLHQLVE